MRAGLARRAKTCHTFRHSFATNLVGAGHDSSGLAGHIDVRTTMSSANVLHRCPSALQLISLVDGL